jgi:hypothetical protein
VQSDLQGLEITKGELKHLSGVDTDEVFRPSVLRNSETRFSFILQEILLALALTPILVGFIYTFIILPTLSYSIPLLILLLIFVPICVGLGRWCWRRNKLTALGGLLDDVDRYNAVIQAINIYDQIESAISTQINLTDREKLVEALKITRDDLVHALRAERIMRENQKIIAANPEFFSTNLQALKALQVTNQASEYGRLLNEALQIGVSVQEEMRKLQNQR